MKAIDFVVRTPVGATQRGSVGGEDESVLIDAGTNNEISLNLRASDVVTYDRAADDLMVTLADGRTIVLEGYFHAQPNDANRLYLSADAEMTEVTFTPLGDGAVLAEYGPTATFGKWSPADELVFFDRPFVAEPTGEDDVSMLAAPLLAAPLLGAGLGGAGWGAAAVGAGVVGAGVIVAGDDSDGGSGGDGDNESKPDTGGEDVGGEDTEGADAGEGGTGGADMPDREENGSDPAFDGDVQRPASGDVEAGGGGDPNGGNDAGGGADGGGDSTTWPGPTVDDPNDRVDFNAEDAPTISVTGTAEPGSTVTTRIGTESVTVTSDEDGIWEAVFEGDDFPADGDYRAEVDVVDPSETEHLLDGPYVEIDTTPPLVDVTSGTVSAGDIVNAEDHTDGADITGTVEPGATLVVTVDSTDHSVPVAEDGSWSVSFDETVIPGGEYSQEITITATDQAGNVTITTDVIKVDTIPHPLTIDPVGSDNIINAQEAGAGFDITGTSTPGAVVTVGFAGSSHEVTTTQTGTWIVNVDADVVTSGEYTSTITATTVDGAGNSSSTTSDVNIDTTTFVEITGTPLTGDDLISSIEVTDGVTLMGTAEVGSSVTITIGKVTQTTTTTETGEWSATFDTTQLASGTYTTTAVVTSTDVAGNTATAQHSFDVDTEITVTLDNGLAGGDDMVNASEADGGFAISGTAEAGAAISVVFQSTTYTTTTTDTGTWAIAVPASDIPAGTYDATIEVSATDAAGNAAITSGSVAVDTQISVAIDTDGLEGDGIVNAAERADGVTLTGTADAGSSVDVSLNGTTQTVISDDAGNWSVDFAAADLPQGELVSQATAVATDAAGNSASASADIMFDTVLQDFTITSTPGGADGVINAAEAPAGLVLTGTTEDGASVTVALDGTSREASVTPDGSWSVTFNSDELPSGEHTLPLEVSSTDAAGNTGVLSQSVVIDTFAGTLTISPDPVEGDDIVNATEASDGVTLMGTSDPGEAVQVIMAGVTKTVVTDADGGWSAFYAPGEVAPGTYEAQITATISDPAGNILTRTDSLRVDTEVVNFAITTDPVAGDDVVNAAEAGAGVVLEGTTEVGGVVSVTVEGATREATVDASGNWSVTFQSGDIPAGQYNTQARVTTTDLAGNTAQVTTSFAVDTFVDTLNISDDPVAGDGTVNRAEAELGVVLQGAVEAGSSVTITVGGGAHVANVSGAGWSVTIPPSALPSGTTTAEVLIEATDAAGNTRSETASFEVDTDAPDVPHVESYTRDLTGLRGISIDTVDDPVDLGHVIEEPDGALGVGMVDAQSFDIPVLGETSFVFAQTVPDGSHLVVRSTDAAGNSASTYLVADDPSTSEVGLNDQLATELGAFNVEAIDLHFAEDSHLTITEAQLVALSSNTDTVSVQGGGDDAVTITGATAQGSQAGADGQTLNVFTLGDATVLIEDDITNVTI